MRYVDYVYDIVRADTEGFDAIYKDYIVSLVGEYGFAALCNEKLLEGCGVICGRDLFALCERKESNDHSEIEELRRENYKLRKFIDEGVLEI